MDGRMSRKVWLLMGVLASTPVMASQTLNTAIGGGAGSVAGAILGQQMGGNTGALAGAAIGGALGGAATAHRGQKNEAALGGALGGLGGAAIGNQMGGQNGQLIGAGVGGATGAVLGGRSDNDSRHYEDGPRYQQGWQGQGGYWQDPLPPRGWHHHRWHDNGWHGQQWHDDGPHHGHHWR